MRIIFVSLILTVFCVTTALAQSGRRIQTPQPTTPVQNTGPQSKDTAAKGDDDQVGYSESSPNSSRTLSPATPRDQKPKLRKKDAGTVGDPSTTPTAETGEKKDDDVIKVDTALVRIPVSVSDRNGFYVSDLYQKDFKVFEDGVEQKIEYFGTTDLPFTVVLLIDVSPSTAYKIEEIQAAAWAFVQQLLPQDQVMVVSFDRSVHVLTEITGDRDKINKAIRRTGFGDGTSLYEAVDFSIRQRLDKIKGRKAIVLFTDGVDTTSFRSSFDSTLREAEESEAVIFPIYFNTFLNQIGIGGGGGVMSTTPTLGVPGMGGGQRGSSSEEYSRGRAYLTELANVTGGKLFRSESTPGGLNNAFESIAEELRRQYSIAYYPINPGSPGERKQIRVRVDRPKLVIRSRDGYIVGKSSSGE